MAVYGLHVAFRSDAEPHFVHAHLHDLMAMPILLGWIDLIVDHSSPVARRLRTDAATALLTLMGAFVWEVVDPLFDPDSVSDPVDAACYAAGAVAYVLLRRLWMRKADA